MEYQTMTTRYQLGTVSEGTLKTDDLLCSFADALRNMSDDRTDKRLARSAIAAAARLGAGKTDGKEEYIREELSDRLGELAPPYCYFGTLEGDGAAFGFWVDHEA